MIIIGYPSNIGVIIVDRQLVIGHQRIDEEKLVIDLVVVMLRERRREKLLRQRIELCEHINQLLHIELRFGH